MNYQDRYFHRQTLVIGQDTQPKVRQLKVYVRGLTMVGLEIVKNLVLMGVKQVMVYDDNIVEKQDTQNSFYYNKNHIGSKRSQSSLTKFKQLSQFTQVACCQSNDFNYMQKLVYCRSLNFDVAVLVDCWDYEFTKNLNYQMHKKNKGFIVVSNLSLYGFIFVDFGANHLITDDNGQREQKCYIKLITLEKQAMIQFTQQKIFQVGDQIYIYHVKGMKEINGKVVRIIKKEEFNLWAKAYTINLDTSEFSQYRSGGIAYVYRKKVKKLAFDLLDDNLRLTNPLKTDTNLVISPQKKLHHQQAVIIKSFYQFYNKKQRTPALMNLDQTQLLKIIASQILDQIGLQENSRHQILKLLKKLALVGSLQISAFATVWGGITAQQIIKITGKYTPINQWLHLNQTDLISDNIEYNENKYNVLFGNLLICNLEASKMMMVGAGSLGSEIIKIASEMNIGSKGLITLVDDDHLNDYNLNRMCLANKNDCGKDKVNLLIQKCKDINNSMNLKSIKIRLKHIHSKQKQKISSYVWKQHDIILSLVDSFSSRNNIDSYCIRYRKKMLNCGTQDLKCSTQVVIPYITLNYSALKDADGVESVPMKGFRYPYKINTVVHTIRTILQQILEVKQELYQLTVNKSQFLSKYYEERNKRQLQVYFKLQNLLHYLQIQKTNSFAACVQQALIKFYQLFYLQVQKLLKWHPADLVQEDSTYFWSGLKNVPQINTINLHDPIHQQFVFSLAAIYAQLLDIQALNLEQTIQIATKLVENKKYIEKSKAKYEKIDYNQPEINNKNYEITQKINSSQFKTKDSINFEPNNPSPLHLSFLYSCSMLSAKKHQIEEASRKQVEKMACRAIPTIITSISIGAGLLILQLIKMFQNNHYKLSKNTYANFALPQIVQSQLSSPKLSKDLYFDPVMASHVKIIPEFHSQWQQIYIVGPMTVRQIKQHLENSFRIQIYSINTGNKFLLGFHQRTNAILENMQISKALMHLQPQSISFPMELSINAEYIIQENTECLLPCVHYYLPQ